MTGAHCDAHTDQVSRTPDAIWGRLSREKRRCQHIFSFLHPNALCAAALRHSMLPNFIRSWLHRGPPCTTTCLRWITCQQIIPINCTYQGWNHPMCARAVKQHLACICATSWWIWECHVYGAAPKVLYIINVSTYRYTSYQRVFHANRCFFLLKFWRFSPLLRDQWISHTPPCIAFPWIHSDIGFVFPLRQGVTGESPFIRLHVNDSCLPRMHCSDRTWECRTWGGATRL